MKVVVISGSPQKSGKTQIMMEYVFNYAKEKNDNVIFVNLAKEDIDYFKGPQESYNETTVKAAKDLTEADVWFVGTPIYNSLFSSALKNLFEFINYKKTEGKIAGLAILASGSIGFIIVQTLLTQLMSYFRVITNPKTVFMTVNDLKGNEIASEDAKNRLRQLVDETLLLASKLKRN